jgi:hypothetical protein
VVNKSGSDRADSKPERGDRNEPARTEEFAGCGGRDLEDDVGNVEGCEDNVVVVAFQMKFLF